MQMYPEMNNSDAKNINYFDFFCLFVHFAAINRDQSIKNTKKNIEIHG